MSVNKEEFNEMIFTRIYNLIDEYELIKEGEKIAIALSGGKDSVLTLHALKNYKDAIKVWTIRDPLKRKIAKENNLNWLEFFSIDDFNIWFQSINKQAINIKTIN